MLFPKDDYGRRKNDYGRRSFADERKGKIVSKRIMSI